MWWVGGMCGGLVVSVLGWWYLWLVVSLVGLVVSMVYCSKYGGLVICMVVGVGLLVYLV